MKRNIFNDEQTFIEWAQHITPKKHISKHIHKKIYKDMRARLHPEESDPKIPYIKKRFKAAAASFVLLICIISIAADSGTQGVISGTFKNDEDIKYFGEQPPLVNPDTNTDIQNAAGDIHSRIVDISSFNSDIFFNTVDDITTKENKLPEFVFGPMDMSVITQEDYSGWELSEGGQLRIDISIEPYYAHADGTGESIVCGYIYNSKYYEFEFQKATEFSFTITADKKGIYYPVFQNVGVSYIHILSGSVFVQ